MGESSGRSLSAICLQHAEEFLFVLITGLFLRRCCDELLHYTV